MSKDSWSNSLTDLQAGGPPSPAATLPACEPPRRNNLMHPKIERIGREFSLIGMATPDVVRRKAELILSPNQVGERVALVAIDQLRCSSTVVSLLAAGAD